MRKLAIRYLYCLNCRKVPGFCSNVSGLVFFMVIKDYQESRILLLLLCSPYREMWIVVRYKIKIDNRGT